MCLSKVYDKLRSSTALIIRLANFSVLLPTVAIDLPLICIICLVCFSLDLPAQSPLIHGIMKNLDQWEAYMKEELDRFLGPPASYIPGCYINNGCEGVNIMKYSSLMDPANTPFMLVAKSSLFICIVQ